MDSTEETFDFIAIGDTVTDDFIRIREASVFTREDADGNKDEELCFINGAKIPYEFSKVVAGVGNAANAAVAAARLGLKSAFISDVGGDAHGKDILAALSGNDVDTRYVRVHNDKFSNFHYVLWHGAERTILIKHEAYPYALPRMSDPKWIYFSSVGENSLPYHQEVTNYIKTHPNVKLAFQPGTFQIKLGAEALSELYKATEIFFCNVEEARIILNTNEPSPEKLPKMMSALGPKISVITDGPKGAYAYEEASGKTYYMPQYPDPKPPYSRTGAGDAFSSTTTVAIALGMSLPEALSWGPINSMSVVQHIGAQEGLVTREQLETYLKERPENYTPTELSIE